MTSSLGLVSLDTLRAERASRPTPRVFTCCDTTCKSANSYTNQSAENEHLETIIGVYITADHDDRIVVLLPRGDSRH